MASSSTLALIFEKQRLHALWLGLLLAALVPVSRIESVRVGELWGRSTPTWFWIAVAVPVLHQGLVWFCWRTQLHANLMTRWFGSAGFSVYAVAFTVLIVGRPVTLVLLAEANRDTLPIAPVATKTLAAMLVLPTAYLFYSVDRYFGFRRAYGIDHFDESCRSAPLVRKGIFRLTPNAMYVFGFLLLWMPGLWYGSTAALCVALFQHVYIWVHYHATELPDMERIYGMAVGPVILEEKR